jgi:hypothetical protein
MDAFITGAPESFEKTLHFLVRPAPKANDRRLKRAALRRSLIETFARCHNQVRTGLALGLHEQHEPFRCDFWIGQNIFNRSEFRFRQEKRIWLPIQQTFVEHFLRMNAGTKNPNRLADLARDGGDQKCLRRLDDVRKPHRPLCSLDCAKFARNWLARSDHFQKLSADRFFHRLAVAEKLLSFKVARVL